MKQLAEIDPDHLDSLNARSYIWFAVLANVRNGYGFAGVYTHEPLVPISEPRGLPEDIGEGAAEFCEHYDHTPSYLTLKEILDYDWGQPLQQGGVVDAHTYREWVKNGRKGPPASWSGGVSGGDVHNISNEEMDELIAKAEDSDLTVLGRKSSISYEKEEREAAIEYNKLLRNKRSYYTSVRWTEPLRNDVRWQVEAVEKIAEQYDPETTRLVFWFDS
jgi:hypothetical protein